MIACWLIACGTKTPVEALPDPIVMATPSALGEGVVEPALVPWVLPFWPRSSDLQVTWRPGPDRDSVEVVLDASSVPAAREYTVVVYEGSRPIVGEAFESQEFSEGPYGTTEPWIFRPMRGIGPTLSPVTVTFMLESGDERPTYITSSAYLFRTPSDSVVALDPDLVEREFQRRRTARPDAYSVYSTSAFGLPGTDFYSEMQP